MKKLTPLFEPLETALQYNGNGPSCDQIGAVHWNSGAHSIIIHSQRTRQTSFNHHSKIMQTITKTLFRLGGRLKHYAGDIFEELLREHQSGDTAASVSE